MYFIYTLRLMYAPDILIRFLWKESSISIPLKVEMKRCTCIHKTTHVVKIETKVISFLSFFLKRKWDIFYYKKKVGVHPLNLYLHIASTTLRDSDSHPEVREKFKRKAVEKCKLNEGKKAKELTALQQPHYSWMKGTRVVW